MRGLAAALLLLVAAPLFAVDTGRADGKAVVGGKTVRFKYSYAYTSGEHDVVVLVTDKALRAKDDPRKPLRRGVQSMVIDFDTDESTRVRRLVIQITDGTFVIDHPEVGMTLNVEEDAIEGSISTTTTTAEPRSLKVRVRIAFNAEYAE